MIANSIRASYIKEKYAREPNRPGAVEYTNRFSAEWQESSSHNECPAYDTKQSDSEVPVMLKLWGMQSTPSLPSLSGRL